MQLLLITMGIVDPLNGINDLSNKIIKSVGNLIYDIPRMVYDLCAVFVLFVLTSTLIKKEMLLQE